jgi:signal transduction histidine kinase
MEIVKKVLVVDDKPENIIALEVILKDLDIQIVSATSGNEALAKTIEHDFALALIDVQMPEMDGYETVKLMRQVEKTKFLPVIFLSAIYSEDHYLIQGIEAGAVDFMTKPFKVPVLLGKVKVFLKLYEQKKLLENEIEQRKQTETYLRETKQKLLEAKIKAEESDKLKTAFLANMSHEIRTPLTSIVGFAGLLSEKELPPSKKEEFAGYIYKSSEGLINLINDILDVAKIEAGQLAINKEPVDVNEVMKELYATFQAKLEKVNKSHIAVRLSLPQGHVKLLTTDESRLKQVIINLLGNAAKFTLQGSIEFGYEIKDKNFRFFVSDTGIGIPEDKYNLIFDRFQKLQNNKVSNTSGTGLGLSIVKKIIELLDGHIWVDSRVNQGTTFTFTLPDVEFSPKTVTDQEPSPEISSEMPDWSSKHILIVEDEYPTFVLLESLLNPTGIHIKWAKNGKEAVETYLDDNKIDAVLMDIRMPVMTGLEAYAELRKMNRKLPIIAQTAYAMAEEKEQFQEIGFNGYLPKPIVKKELLNLLNSIFK